MLYCKISYFSGSVETDQKEVTTDEIKTDVSHRRQSNSSQGSSSAFDFVSDEPITDSPKNTRTNQTDTSANLARGTQSELITDLENVPEARNLEPNEANSASDLSVGNSRVDHKEQESVNRELLEREAMERGIMDQECDSVVTNLEDHKTAKDSEVHNQQIDTSNDLQIEDSSLESKQRTRNAKTKEGDIAVHDETMRDLKSVLDQGGSISTDVSYELKLNEDEKIEIYLETLKSRETALRYVSCCLIYLICHYYSRRLQSHLEKLLTTNKQTKNKQTSKQTESIAKDVASKY